MTQLRADRSADDVRRALDELKAAAEGTENVLYPRRAALAARGTVGEVCNALRDVWGIYQPANAF